MKKKTVKINNKDSAEKVIGQFKVDRNAMVDEGKGLVRFSKGLTITDNSEQWSGTKYDIKTLDVDSYTGKLTADHVDRLENIIGKTYGAKKVGNRVVIDSIQFAIDINPYAVLAYNLLLAGYATDFSTETVGPWSDDEGVLYNHKLVGLSMVVNGNNQQARVNEILVNSIKQAEEKGLDADDLKAILKTPIDNKIEVVNNEEDMKLVRIKNTRKFNISVKFTNQQGQEEEKELKPGETVDVAETDADKVQETIDGAEDPTPAAPTPTKPESTDTETPADQTNAIGKAVAEAMKPVVEQMQKFNNDFNTNVIEPSFTPGKATKLSDLDWKERTEKQVNAVLDGLKGTSPSALKTLNDINQYNLETLKKEGLVRNALTISDFGNFVISAEQFKEIEGTRSNFRPLLEKFTFTETLSTQMAWLERNGDVNMQEVEFCDDGADGNLKPLSEYDATIKTSNLSEVAAVTPVCNAATRFLAADLLADVNQGYRTDYDRKRAQLLIARLQQAVNASGNTSIYNTAASSTLNPLFSIIEVGSDIAENIDSGVWIFNTKTYWELMRRRMAAGANQNDAFSLFTTGDAGPLFLGSPYIVVPNELMPTLNTAETKTFVVDGVNVTINQAMFYVDPSTWSGRTSGGLQYDMSIHAAYEVGGGVVKSAFQRNELLLRGSFFRGGAVRDIDKVAGLGRAGVS